MTRAPADLFGEVPLGPGGLVKRTKRKDPRPSGYARPPGTGPKGETCKTCAHLYRNHLAKTYLKCELNRAAWTGGRKTDVLASAPACEKWSAPE
jgi:hypothetical protein